MPWVRVIKTVKGRPYAYLQRSFRDGGTVRTESRYLGPASAVDRPAGAPADPPPAPPDATPTNTPDDLPPSRRFVGITARQRLRFRFVPSTRHLSPERMQQEYRRVLEWAQGLGVPPEGFPRVALREGKAAGLRRSWGGGGMVVTVGRHEGRKAARRAFADALGHAFLDGVRASNPLAYGALAGRLDPSFRTTNRLVFQALALGGEQSRLALTLQIHAFGRLHPVAGTKADSIGLPGYGKRGGWEDEAAALIGEIATRGFRDADVARRRAVSTAYAAEYKARRAVEQAGAFDRITGQRRALKRKLVAATAARLATEEARRKLDILAGLVPELAR